MVLDFIKNIARSIGSPVAFAARAAGDKFVTSAVFQSLIEKVKDLKDELNETIKETGVPTGSVTPFAGQSAPSGWLLCNGAAVSRTTYAALYAIIGTTYGSGNGSNTFNLPDLQGRFPLGANSTYARGAKGGEETHILTVDEMPSHTHTQNAHNHSASGSSASAGAHTHTLTVNSGGSHNHTASSGSNGSHAHDIIIYGYGRSASLNSGSDSSYRIQYDASTANYSSGRFYTQTSGSHTHSVTVNSGGSHSHTGSAQSAGAHSHTITVSVSSTTATNQNTGGGKSHNNMPPYLAMNYIIKY